VTTRAYREEEMVPVRFRLVIDCADPDRLAGRASRVVAGRRSWQLPDPPAGDLGLTRSLL
jgi:hypothetical protein